MTAAMFEDPILFAYGRADVSEDDEQASNLGLASQVIALRITVNGQPISDYDQHHVTLEFQPLREVKSFGGV